MLNAQLINRDPAGVSIARVELDVAAQPFLEDHRVGSRAILSTVMSLEAMGQAALQVHRGSVVSSVDQLIKRGPLFVTDGVAQTIEVEVMTESPGVLRCRIVSDPEGVRVQHDEALLTLADQLTDVDTDRLAEAHPFWARPPAGMPGPPAAQALVYELFFHGPSFQVVGSAQLLHDALMVTLNPHLPPATRPPQRSAVSARLIELCLQGAGLLELEQTGQMMIPASLDQVVRHRDVPSESGPTLRAVVRRRPESMIFDAVLLDDRDQVYLEVLGYRTAPFDQPVDGAAVAALVAALRG